MIPVLDDDAHDRPTAGCFRLHTLKLTELLTGTFNGVADLVGNLLGARTGVRGDDKRFLDGKLGIFEPTDISIGPDSPHEDQNHEEKNDPFILDGRDAKIHGRLLSS